MRVCSLFTGVGGLDLGLQQVGQRGAPLLTSPNGGGTYTDGWIPGWGRAATSLPTASVANRRGVGGRGWPGRPTAPRQRHTGKRAATPACRKRRNSPATQAGHRIVMQCESDPGAQQARGVPVCGDGGRGRWAGRPRASAEPAAGR
jgi:hypothetical protein